MLVLVAAWLSSTAAFAGATWIGNLMRGTQISLDTIASETGGGIFFAPTRDEQRKIFQRIRDEVRGQYLLAFTAPEAKPGSWRRIKVDVPKLRPTVHTIVGYYAR